MSIWANENITLEDMTERAVNTMSDFLGIEFSELGDDYLCGTMPVNERTRQPIGIMHGGASCVLAETIGSNAANFCVDLEKFYCVGLDINTSHIRSVREGLVTARAEPVHLGRSTQVWRIDIFDSNKRLVSTTRLTMAVLART